MEIPALRFSVGVWSFTSHLWDRVSWAGVSILVLFSLPIERNLRILFTIIVLLLKFCWTSELES